MEKEILYQVIEVEKEIQKAFELEKSKAKEWLESVKAKYEEEYLREEAKIKASLEQSVNAAVKLAEEKSDEILKAGSLAAERLKQLDMKSLQGIIERTIAEILPR